MSPYKDPARRRQCQRESKARWRKKQVKIRPLLETKVYLCLQYPYVRVIGNSRYFEPFLITSDADLQAQIEAHHEFGVHIFPLALDLDLVGPIMDDDEDE